MGSPFHLSRVPGRTTRTQDDNDSSNGVQEIRKIVLRSTCIGGLY